MPTTKRMPCTNSNLSDKRHATNVAAKVEGPIFPKKSVQNAIYLFAILIILQVYSSLQLLKYAIRVCDLSGHDPQ